MHVKMPIHAGSMAPVVCSSYYCPPESAQALAAGQAAMLVHPSTDVWSLGVLAFELLSHVRDPSRAQPASPGVEARSSEKVVSAWGPGGSGGQLGKPGWVSAEALPWEGISDSAEEARRKLGMLRGVVLSCVNRDGSQRPSAAMALAAFESAQREVARNRARRKPA
jgi:serine/threonine protein kinase